jgi:hypothetical protein
VTPLLEIFPLKHYVFLLSVRATRPSYLSILDFIILTIFDGSRDSSVGIATRYGLEGPGIESRWGEIFRTDPDRLRGPPSLLYNGYRVCPGGKGDRGVMLTTQTLLVPRLIKS